VRVIVKDRQQTEDHLSSDVATWEIGKKSTLPLGGRWLNMNLVYLKTVFR
jgi:hypothetical protein